MNSGRCSIITRGRTPRQRMVVGVLDERVTDHTEFSTTLTDAVEKGLPLYNIYNCDTRVWITSEGSHFSHHPTI